MLDQFIYHWTMALIEFGMQHQGFVWTCIGALLFFITFRIWYADFQKQYDNPER